MAKQKCRLSRQGCTATLFGSKPEATMNQPIAPCSPPRTKSRTSQGISRASMRRVAMNTTSGTKNTTPISRPQSR